MKGKFLYLIGVLFYVCVMVIGWPYILFSIMFSQKRQNQTEEVGRWVLGISVVITNIIYCAIILAMFIPMGGG